MFVKNLVGAFFKFDLASRLIKGVDALLPGGATLWWMVERVGTAIVHVIEPDVEVISCEGS